jgi:N4-(beta-N-acetylglucosaminyl)-L-asparaginase
MFNRKEFLKFAGLSIPLMGFKKAQSTADRKPLVISTWDAGIQANLGAWKILAAKGTALDAVEAGVMVTENEQNCCVGLGANPDRDGFVTLDASIMDEHGNCGSVAFLERIKHPIAVARRVMEKTPHVMLAGTGAQQFAVKEGFILESQKLSPSAEKNYKQWLKKSEYKPVINIENNQNNEIAAVPTKLSNGEWNHDTIGMLAFDASNNLSGSCTTSGAGYKMRGRIGDSPIIGAGLYVDNEIGAAVATGQGEDIIRICGSHTVVEMMRNGYSPEMACKKTIERLYKKIGDKKARQIQAAFIAINKKGEYGGFSLQKGFDFAVCYAADKNFLVRTKFLI